MNETVKAVAYRVILTLGPIIAALIFAGILLAALGIDPLKYYGFVIKRGLLSPSGVQQTLTLMAPLLFLAAGLIVAFRAGIWNLGTDGQFLLGAVAAAGSAPFLIGIFPTWATLIIATMLSMIAAMIWSLVPALLRAYHGVNEIITTLMMTFLGALLANALVKLIFLDPATSVPQTRTLAVADRLSRLFDTTISSSLIYGLIAIIAVHLLMTKTALGLKFRIVGENPKAALHSGLNVSMLTVLVFVMSSGLSGIAGAVTILGVQGNVRADWNPAYSFVVSPTVFLARFNGYASIAFVLMLSVLTTGGESAARRMGVPTVFILVLVATVLIFLAIAEYADHRHKQARRI